MNITITPGVALITFCVTISVCALCGWMVGHRRGRLGLTRTVEQYIAALEQLARKEIRSDILPKTMDYLTKKRIKEIEADSKDE